MSHRLAWLIATALLAGCALRGPAGTAVASPTSIDSISIPPASGPLDLRVVYPQPNGTIAARDSTFLLGSLSSGSASLTIDGQAVRVHPNGAWLAWVALPPDSAFTLRLVATTSADTMRLDLPLQRAGPSNRRAVLDSLARGLLGDTAPVLVQLDDDPGGTGTTDSITIGRNLPGGTYHWFFARGTRTIASGQVGGLVRLRLSDGTFAWVPAAEAIPLGPAALPPLAVAGSIDLVRTSAGIAIRIPLGAMVPVSVQEGERTIALTIHSALGDINWTRYAPADDLVERVDWRQEADRVVVEVHLRAPLWGYRTRWQGTDLLLEVRRPPCPVPGAPLRGRVIAIDPGHPPAGATGPTGLAESEANLAIAGRLRVLLEQAGARVVMTRVDATPLDLTSRIRLAEAAGAEVLVSIHNNAVPDGVNPFTSQGSSVFYNHAQSLPLARSVQGALVQRLGVRDLGVGRGDLAMVRPTWQPSILTEGLFMIVPEHEAALRVAEGQERYARGVADGLAVFLAARGDDCESQRH